MTKDARDQMGVKNTQAKRGKLCDQIKEVICVGGRLISLYKKEGRTPTRTVRQPNKVSDLQGYGHPRQAFYVQGFN